MKTTTPRLPKAERDRILIEVITRSRNVMMLLQGTRVTVGRKSAFLDFKKEILKLTYALQVSGLDAPTPTLQQPVPKNMVPREFGSRSSRTQFF